MYNSKYSNLYNTAPFMPSSISTEDSTPNRRGVFGETRKLQGNKTMQSVTNQNYMTNLNKTTLTNKTNFRDLRNKALYSLDSSVAAHSALNIL